jgi:hypothetical protein
MKTFAVALFIASAAARHHHHDAPIGVRFIEEHEEGYESLESMSDSKLVESLGETLNSALDLEARDDKAAAVAKTAAIKNIQKALTARILKRLDDGQPLVEVARKMKAIEGMQPQINDMERRLGIMQSVEPVLENAIKTLQKVVDVRGMGKKAFLQIDEQVLVRDDDKGCIDGKKSFLRDAEKYATKEKALKEGSCKNPCEEVERKEKEAKEKAADAEAREGQLEIIEKKKEAKALIDE